MSEQPLTSTSVYRRQVPETDFKKWATAARLELQTYIRQLPDVPSKRGPLEDISKKLSLLEYAMVGSKSESTAREEFVSWLEEYDTGGWARFADERARLETARKQEKEEKDRRSTIAGAPAEAIKLTKKYGAGAGVKVGTVIAVLVHAKTGKLWSGTSGEYTTSEKHPLMKTILTGVVQVEDWPVAACGEVAAMNAYLHDSGTTDLSQLPSGTLFFHAQTWNAKDGKWQARAACKNCDQWLKKIGAGRV
ncbi:hypothetical protein Misp01_71150 [Microtetraspora sp. NBRC 13810]|uniref:hypothetical protein n=1 Tax=Microtetraspora sp. NBRC 13810 TaxID=3030990 RepID=UPI0024A1C52D|nr:hypothetical protein [Microtetraspora sp. NBRC 13810]GLW11987.1 hypothetical protein Misp01_71150 [Microtetraspora sp. NBRC 13810]